MVVPTKEMPNTMEFLKGVNEYITTTLGAWASVAGVVIALIGFFITIRNVAHSKSAAEQAKESVHKLRADSIRMDLVSDCTTAISLMDQIKTLHRQQSWMLLPDKYSAIRKVLISVKAYDSNLTDVQKSTIQGSVQIFRGMEKKIEQALQIGPDKLDIVKLNTLISEQADSLQEVLIAVKEQIGR